MGSNPPWENEITWFSQGNFIILVPKYKSNVLKIYGFENPSLKFDEFPGTDAIGTPAIDIEINSYTPKPEDKKITQILNE